MGGDSLNPKDKLGQKKPPMNLVPPSSIAYEALAMRDGAEKYGPYNWRDSKVRSSIYVAACMRHLLAWQDGEDNAEDSGISHLAHAKACLGILIDAIECDALVDDRPSPGGVARVIKRSTRE